MIIIPSVALHYLMMAAGVGVIAVAAIVVIAVWLKTRLGGTRGTDTDL